MALTAAQVKGADARERPYKLTDGGGLFLLVHHNGGKYWRYRYRIDGKEKLFGLGTYPDLSLAEARKRHMDARRQVLDSIDPAETRKADKVSRQATARKARNTFRQVADTWYKTKLHDKSSSYRDRTWRLLKNDLTPGLGDRPIDEIDTQELLAILRKIEDRGAVDMARRARQTAGQVFRFGIAEGVCQSDPSVSLRGALKVRKKKHYASITDPAEVGGLLVAIDTFQGKGTPIVATALRLSPYLFQRPGEIRAMEWAELDLDTATWAIPGEKMKMGEPHIVPLSTQALGLLREIEPYTRHQGKYVFPSARGPSRCLSDNALRVALRSLGFDNDTMTPHGFRAMARTLLDEVLEFRVDWIEHQLAHQVRDANGRAYNRTSHIKGRREMMQRWADYLDQLRAVAKSENVVQLARHADNG